MKQVINGTISDTGSALELAYSNAKHYPSGTFFLPRWLWSSSGSTGGGDDIVSHPVW